MKAALSSRLPSLALALTASVLASCSPPAGVQAASATPATVRIVATDFGFSPQRLQVPVGRPVTLVFDNQGKVEHDWEIEALDLELEAEPGHSETKVVTFDKPGSYQVTCSLPYHHAYGMAGTLLVNSDRDAAIKALPDAGTGTAANVKPLPTGLSRLPQPAVAPPITRSDPAVVPVALEARETTALIADGVATKVWTFGGTVPGPMVRVRQGDTVELTLTNASANKLTHSIDLHAATGAAGGGEHTQIAPGGSAVVRFQALNPGVYVYHCASPKVAHHIANGMYGLIVVEPPQGLPKVDREFYVMQGEMYLTGERGQSGLHDFSLAKMLQEQPDYVLFNGSVGALSGAGALQAAVGETVRLFFGVGGPNLASSLHAMGESFDRVHVEGAADASRHIQTTLVPPGGATMAEFTVDHPGPIMLVDHSLGRMDKGAVGMLHVSGPERPDVMQLIRRDPGKVVHDHD